ncbi:MAG: ATP-binding protein [archaeon]|nr:ATP-binding protein [archaeon]
MLLRFSVSNYRGFRESIGIDLTDKKNYQFGKECVRGDFLDKVIIVGANGAGKTNLGYAMVDIISTLTGYSRDIGQCDGECFVNGNGDSDHALFHYEFTYQGTYITYEYGKRSPEEIVSEKLIIDRVIIFDYSVDDLAHGNYHLERVDAAKIDINTLDGKKALLRRIIEETYQDRYSVIRAISDFASHTLYYRAMWKKDEHIGIIDEDDDLDRFILGNGYIGELTAFLRDVGAVENEIVGVDGRLMIRTAHRDIPFDKAASRGTMILCRLYCWIKRCIDKDALIFFDDFDDMFHYRPAERAIRNIISSNRAICIFVTHNTGLISNDFLRPDCCFILEDGRISSLASRTDKDLRRGHNLEKMLREGEFDRPSEEE